MWQPDIVIYHFPCADGFAAAWACHTQWPAAEYYPTNYGAAPPDVTGKRVLIVDFSYKRGDLLQMAETAHTIVVLDHHKTAEADLRDFIVSCPNGFSEWAVQFPTANHEDSETPESRISAWFDMSKSGARLAWEFARPGVRVPMLIQLIEDRDLWRFALPDSKPFAAWLRTIELSFDAWSRAQSRLEDEPTVLMAEARLMQRYHDAVVDELAAKAYKHFLFGKEVPVLNCSPTFASDVGNRLLSLYPDAPFSGTYYLNGAGEFVWSLRSEDRRTDVAEVAKLAGGGGHRNAAGFRVDCATPNF